MASAGDWDRCFVAGTALHLGSCCMMLWRCPTLLWLDGESMSRFRAGFVVAFWWGWVARERSAHWSSQVASPVYGDHSAAACSTHVLTHVLARQMPPLNAIRHAQLLLQLSPGLAFQRDINTGQSCADQLISDIPLTVLDRTCLFPKGDTGGLLHLLCLGLKLLTCLLPTCLADEEEEDYMDEGPSEDEHEWVMTDGWRDLEIDEEERRRARRTGAPHYPGVPF